MGEKIILKFIVKCIPAVRRKFLRKLLYAIYAPLVTLYLATKMSGVFRIGVVFTSKEQ